MPANFAPEKVIHPATTGAMSHLKIIMAATISCLSRQAAEPACQSWCKLRAENHARMVSMPNRRPISAIANTLQGGIAPGRFPPYR